MPERTGSNDYVIRVLDDPAGIAALRWNALLDAQADGTPFMRHEYLVALHESGSAVADTGWLPQFLVVEAGDELIAACPLYLKDHSYGEYVFDWAWADAYQRHGLRYYPKLLSAVPFTPVPGPRLLARDAASRGLLLRAMAQIAHDAGLSSAHVLFLDAADFLSTLQREKRKKIQQERRRVAEAGIRFTVQAGGEIHRADWDFFHRCYTRTYRAHHSTPYLTRDFFARMAVTMPEHWVLFTAWKDDRRVACSLVAVDRRHGSAYGRYWGAVEQIPFLHFEACYYQPLAWCIEHGMRRFEGGAQGEHKMARGLMPVQTWSAHWLAHPQFARAVADFLEREGAGVEHYLDELNERRPFKTDAAL